MNYAKVGQKIKSKYPEYSDLSDEQVGKMIVKKYPQYENLGYNFIEKAVDSDALPIIGTLLGLGGGAILAPFTMGASLPFGGIAGYGGGKAMQESLQDLMGLQKQTSREQLGEAVAGAATAGTIGEMGAIGRGLLQPMKVVGEIRDVSLGNRTVSPDINKRALAVMQTNNQYAPSETKQVAEDQLNNFLKQFISPQSPGKMTSVYQELPKFEKQTGAYKGSVEPFAKGSEEADRAVRTILSADSPWVARQATNVMGILNKSKPVVQKALPWLAGGGGVAGLGSYLWNRFKK